MCRLLCAHGRHMSKAVSAAVLPVAMTFLAACKPTDHSEGEAAMIPCSAAVVREALAMWTTCLK